MRSTETSREFIYCMMMNQLDLAISSGTKPMKDHKVMTLVNGRSSE